MDEARTRAAFLSCRLFASLRLRPRRYARQ